jgi:glycerol-3-phosphate cytidylyltransferase
MGLKNCSAPIVYLPGSWDLLHAGHTSIMKRASELGCLIIGVSTDNLIQQYKGMKPIISYKDRLSVIKDLKYVCKTIKQSEFFNIKQMRNLHINIIVLGTDWENKPFPELERCVETLGIKVVYIPYTQRLSSTSIKEKIIRNAIPIIKSQTKRTK